MVPCVCEYLICLPRGAFSAMNRKIPCASQRSGLPDQLSTAGHGAPRNLFLRHGNSHRRDLDANGSAELGNRFARHLLGAFILSTVEHRVVGGFRQDLRFVGTRENVRIGVCRFCDELAPLRPFANRAAIDPGAFHSRRRRRHAAVFEPGSGLRIRDRGISLAGRKAT